ncbi:MAG: bifunctional diaminohydroxyphosphoribosylaminopyrimidine deaminase/5-amino-6-(5-phosphoribosylamino)uracil reductase RibD [Nitratireductor sp.]|nr:bifunctional diaminohydroxyphosphoribosylaminopyrimidine deaminase/5-amino-6-(5-phosphoribosylamino)uracil reductase RibD [Nitratireductor sp.]
MPTTELDQRYMAAAIRLARRNQGQTGTNPSVACLIVRHDASGSHVVGSGITQKGGRPHAEPVALAEAGELARGATAYVTLEPCAHHGATPPCAETLISAGVARVVTAVVDPDGRVHGKGHAMLREAGIAVEAGLMAQEAKDGLRAYLIHKTMKRPQVTLKLAVSADGMLGVRGSGQVAITGAAARAQTHLMRARHHAILIGSGTVIEDDPELTCRLEGLQARSPRRIVLDPAAAIPLGSKLMKTASAVPTIVAASSDIDPARRDALAAAGCLVMPCETVGGKVALPELLEDLAATGIMSLMVEGGARVAASFLEAGLVDEIVLFEGPVEVGNDEGAIPSPVTASTLPAGFEECDRLVLPHVAAGGKMLGTDIMIRYVRADQE